MKRRDKLLRVSLTFKFLGMTLVSFLVRVSSPKVPLKNLSMPRHSIRKVQVSEDDTPVLDGIVCS